MARHSPSHGPPGWSSCPKLTKTCLNDQIFPKSGKTLSALGKNGHPQDEGDQKFQSRGYRARTGDPLIKSQLLYQLS